MQGPFTDPIQYMMAIVNDLGATCARRDRMAIEAAKHLYARPTRVQPIGKKEQSQADAQEIGDADPTYGVPPAPRLVKAA